MQLRRDAAIIDKILFQLKTLGQFVILAQVTPPSELSLRGHLKQGLPHGSLD